MKLSACRACNSLNPKLHSEFAPLPIHLWPLANPNSKVPHRQEELGLYVCDQCGHMQLQEMSDELVQALYAEGYPVEDDTVMKQKRLALLKGHGGAELFAGKKVLDVGGGNNPFAGLIPEAERWIVDIEKSALDLKGKAAEHVVVADFVNADLPEDYFDLINAFHVIEHFRWPLESVRRMSKLVKEGGRVLVEVPNFKTVAQRMPCYAVFHQHQSMFTMESLCTLFGQAQFSCETIIREDDVLLAVFVKSEMPVKIHAFDGKSELDRYRDRLRAFEGRIRQSPAIRQDRPLGIYGAGGSSMLFLAHFPWIRERVALAFDRDLRKQARFIPGSDIPVMKPEMVSSAVALGGMIFPSESVFKLIAPSFSGLSYDFSQDCF